MASPESISKLKSDIARVKADIEREKKREQLEVEEEQLRKQLKDLKLTPAQRRELEKKNRFRNFAKKGFSAIKKQAMLIQEQQDRERVKKEMTGKELKKTASGITLERSVKKKKVVDPKTGKVVEKPLTASELKKILSERNSNQTRRNVPAQLKKFQFKKKNKAASKSKRKKSKGRSNDPFGGITNFPIQGL